MEKFLKILILEDSQDDADMIQRELKKAGIVFKATVVNKRQDFENALQQIQPDVILSDHSLPQFNSIEALKLYKQYKDELNLSAPFILITGSVSEEFSVQCIKGGADDYILKDRLKRLPASIQSALDKGRIEQERKIIMDEVIANEAMMKEAEKLSHFGSWQTDLNTGKSKWSDEVYRIFGYEPGSVEPSYEKILNHIHPDEVLALKEQFEIAVINLDSYACEIRILDKNKDLKYLDSKILIKRNQEGLPIALSGFILDITNRKLTDIQLQKSEQEYKSLFEQNPDGVFSLDLEGRFTNVNEGLTNIVGISADQLIQLNFTVFLSEEDGARVYRHFQEVKRGKAQRYDAKFINGHGKEIILDITTMPIVVNNEIVGVHGVAKDITEKKELHSLLNKVNTLAVIGGWEVDLVNHKVSWTSITKEIYEVPEDFEPDFESTKAFFKGDTNKALISEVVNRTMKDGKPFDLELKIITAKDNERWVRVIGEAIMHGEKCVRLYGSFQDIHSRKQAEETLKDAYTEKNSILESIGDAFFAVDKNWTVTYWNNMAEVKLNMPKEKILGKNLWDVYSEAFLAVDYHAHYHKAMNESVIVHFQEFYPSLNIWVEVTAYPSPAGLSVYLRDVTELMHYTKAIEAQNAKLKEIGWIQSHEVRAPLARMMGLIHLIKDFPDTETNKTEILDLVVQSAHELDGLIRAIVRKTENLDNKDQ